MTIKDLFNYIGNYQPIRIINIKTCDCSFEGPLITCSQYMDYMVQFIIASDDFMNIYVRRVVVND